MPQPPFLTYQEIFHLVSLFGMREPSVSAITTAESGSRRHNKSPNFAKPSRLSAFWRPKEPKPKSNFCYLSISRPILSSHLCCWMSRVWITRGGVEWFCWSDIASSQFRCLTPNSILTTSLGSLYQGGFFVSPYLELLMATVLHLTLSTIRPSPGRTFTVWSR